MRKARPTKQSADAQKAVSNQATNAMVASLQKRGITIDRNLFIIASVIRNAYFQMLSGTITQDEAQATVNATIERYTNTQDEAKVQDKLTAALLYRRVKHLLHFTQETNIDSIIQNGLIPRNAINTLAAKPNINDDIRLDNREHMNCLSIGFPNYQMFYKYRMVSVTQGIEWGILLCSANVLLDKHCLFIPTNAASSSTDKQNDNDYKGIKAFEALYADIEGKPTREELGLPNDWPTNPQAEVMVEGIIEPKYILGIAFNDDALTNKYKLKYPNLAVMTEPSLWKPRIDYIHWKKTWHQDLPF